MMNFMIGKFIPVKPEAFLELLVEHPHLIGNTKVLLNFVLDFDIIDNTLARNQAVWRRINAIESVSRPDLSAVQREVLNGLYSGVRACSR